MSLDFHILFRRKYFIFIFHLYFHINVYGLDIFSSKILFILIMGKKTKLVHVKDITSLYFIEEMIDKLYHDIIFSNTGRERGVIMKPYLKDERVDMDTFGEPYSPYFYVHLPNIYVMKVLIPFTSFKT